MSDSDRNYPAFNLIVSYAIGFYHAAWAGAASGVAAALVLGDISRFALHLVALCTAAFALPG